MEGMTISWSMRPCQRPAKLLISLLLFLLLSQLVLDLTLSYSLKGLLNGDIPPPHGTSDLVTLRLTPKICDSNKLHMELVGALGPHLGAVHWEHPQRNEAVATVDATSAS